MRATSARACQARSLAVVVIQAVGLAQRILGDGPGDRGRFHPGQGERSHGGQAHPERRRDVRTGERPRAAVYRGLPLTGEPQRAGHGDLDTPGGLVVVKVSQQDVGDIDGLGAPLDQAEQLHAPLAERQPGVLAGPHRVERREDQVARGLRHGRCRLAGRVGEESRGRLVAGADARPGVGRDGQGLARHVAQVPGAPLVQGPAGAFGQVGVDRFADQIVPERKSAGPVVCKEAGADCLAEADG